MNALSYLFFVKLKAQLRRLFSKPVSAIVTLFVLAFFGFSIYSAVSNREMMSAMMNVQSVQGWMMLFCGYVLFLMTVKILQKRSAIVTRDDAQFIFAGPFTRKQTLAYLLIETVEGSLIYALIAVAYILMMMSSTVILTVPLVLSLILSSLLMFYFAFALFTWFYFLELVKPQAKWIKYGFLAVLLGFIGLIAIRNVGVDGGIQSTITRFVADPLFNWVPVFGWCKMALIGLVSQDMTACLIGFAATLLVCAGITALILNVKGDFYEQAIMDAEWISELRQNARARRAQSQTHEKVVSVKQARFGSGAAALVSKNLLILRKTRRLLSLQEVLLIVIYLGIVWMNGQGFGFYQFFVLIVLFTSATTDEKAGGPDGTLDAAHCGGGVRFVGSLSVCAGQQLGGTRAGGVDDDRFWVAVSQCLAGLSALDEKPLDAAYGTDDQDGFLSDSGDSLRHHGRNAGDDSGSAGVHDSAGRADCQRCDRTGLSGAGDTVVVRQQPDGGLSKLGGRGRKSSLMTE